MDTLIVSAVEWRFMKIDFSRPGQGPEITNISIYSANTFISEYGF
jgi:hypothetical protein